MSAWPVVNQTRVSNRKRNHPRRSGASSAPISVESVWASGAPWIVARTFAPNAMVIAGRDNPVVADASADARAIGMNVGL